jgi:hypothetical protein
MAWEQWGWPGKADLWLAVQSQSREVVRALETNFCLQGFLHSTVGRLNDAVAIPQKEKDDEEMVACSNNSFIRSR